MTKIDKEVPHPIFDAIFEENIKKIKKLVQEGCDLNYTFEEVDTDGWTPLMCAVCWCSHNTKVVQTLIKLGADVHQKISFRGDNALMVCTRQGTVENFDYLVSQMGERFDINAKNDNGSTPLMIAACYGWVDMIEGVLKYEPNLKLKDEHGQNALQIAKFDQVNDRQDAVRVLEAAFLKEKIMKEKTLLHKRLKSIKPAQTKVVSKL